MKIKGEYCSVINKDDLIESINAYSGLKLYFEETKICYLEAKVPDYGGEFWETIKNQYNY